MRARRLNSSMIERILFDEDQGTLAIWFRGSGKYIYSGVPAAIYDALSRAQSAGAFFNRCVKGRFPCRSEGRRRYPLE